MTLSSLGDGMSFVTIIWLSYHLTASTAVVSGVVIAYGAPVVVGGLLAG